MLPCACAILLAASALGAGPADTTVRLTAVAQTVAGAPASRFRVNEPVWIALTLANQGPDSVRVLVSYAENHGAHCEPQPGYRGAARPVERSEAVDVMWGYEWLPPHGAIAAGEFPLSDYLRVTRDDVLPLHLTLPVRSADRQQEAGEVSAECTLTFRGRLTSAALRGVAGALDSVLASGNEEVRCRAVRSAVVLGKSAALPVLRTAIADRSDVVQLDAASVAAELGAVEILQQAAGSRYEAVRAAAQAGLARWRTGKSP
jgi:hypothetical protein